MSERHSDDAGSSPAGSIACYHAAMRYRAILADPPWKFEDQGTRLSPEYEGPQRDHAHYRTMTLGDVVGMGTRVKELAEDDSFLFLWAPNAIVLSGDARRVAEAWGFKVKQLITWVKVDSHGKPRIGGGHYTRVCTEQLLLCRRGKPQRKDAGVTGVIVAERGEHSAKPDEQYKKIERFCDGPYLELFARKKRESWHAWGDEVEFADVDIFGAEAGSTGGEKGEERAADGGPGPR